MTVASSLTVKDNRFGLETIGGYLFLCCVIYSSNRFTANKRAMKPSCRSIIRLTPSLAEGEKICSLRSRKKQPPPTGRVCARRNAKCSPFAVRLTRTEQSALPRGVPKVTIACDISIIRHFLRFVKRFFIFHPKLAALVGCRNRLGGRDILVIPAADFYFYVVYVCCRVPSPPVLRANGLTYRPMRQ